MTKEADLPFELVVEEYKTCRDLIKLNIDIIEKSELYAIGAVAATAAYTISAPTEAVRNIACWTPLIIAFLGYLRFIGLDSTIDKVNNYLEKIENKHKTIDWTHDYRVQNKWKILKASRHAIWIGLVIIGTVFGGYVVHQPDSMFSRQVPAIKTSPDPHAPD